MFRGIKKDGLRRRYTRNVYFVLETEEVNIKDKNEEIPNVS